MKSLIRIAKSAARECRAGIYDVWSFFRDGKKEMIMEPYRQEVRTELRTDFSEEQAKEFKAKYGKKLAEWVERAAKEIKPDTKYSNFARIYTA
jgi:bifunctional DNA-binding transcriptional regulator/antitoxin component of YhaV-PrlF toxin-antitoxin module